LRPGTPVIISSGYDESEVAARFPGQIIEFLQKPFTANQLAERIKTALAAVKA
jgi:DNA-binding NtrC family response regulator